MIKKIRPMLPMGDGRDAFRQPFGYGLVCRDQGNLSVEYYLLPFNYFMRLWLWLKGVVLRKKK